MMDNLIGSIILADCMDIMKDMPDNYIDLAIVDPPYGIGETDKSSKHKKIYWNNEYPNTKYFDELDRISKNQIIWGANYYFNMIKSSGRIIWNKLGTDIGRRLTTKSFSDCEIASHSFGLNVKMFSYTWIGNVRGNNYHIEWNNEKKIHPQQKPEQLYRWLLQNYAKEGNLILDTHSGSGSCAIACHLEGYDFIAIEKDPDYHRDSVKRLEEEMTQSKLF